MSGVRQGSNFILLYINIQFLPHHLLRRPPFPHRILHAVARVKFSFLWLNSIPLYKCPIAVLSTHLLMDYLGYICILVIVNNAAMNIGVLMFFQISVLDSLGSKALGNNSQKWDHWDKRQIHF